MIHCVSSKILTNILSNAVKFTDKGKISVSVDLDKDSEQEVTLRFVVDDTGIGMSQEQLDHLFQAFYQADPSSTRQHGGTGLGLAISKRLIQKMGGEIDVTSKLGKGSQFVFTAKFSKSNKTTSFLN